MTKYEQAIREAAIPQDPLQGGRRTAPTYDGYAVLREATKHGLPADWDLRTRDRFVHRFSFAIPNDEALDVIAEHGPVLEVGAGSGYWAHELAARGVDIVATDPHPVGDEGEDENGYGFTQSWHPVEKLHALVAIRRYPGRALLMVWPTYEGSWSGRAVAAFRGRTVIVVGEGAAGCTGDARSHRLLAARFNAKRCVHIPTWSGINDRLTVWGRI